MGELNNTTIVTKAANVILLVAWLLIIAGSILILITISDIHLVLWKIYIGIACLASGAFSLALYAILKGLEPITRACEIHLSSIEEDEE